MNIRWNQIAVAVAAGFLAGALFSDYYHMHIKRRPPKQAPAEGAIEMITRELDLTGQQKDKVAATLEKYRPEIKKVYLRVEKDDKNFGRIFVHFRY